MDYTNLTNLTYIAEPSKIYTDIDLIKNYCFFLNDTAGELILIMFSLYILCELFFILNYFIFKKKLNDYYNSLQKIIYLLNFIIVIYLSFIIFIDKKLVDVHHFIYIKVFIIAFVSYIFYYLYKNGYLKKISKEFTKK